MINNATDSSPGKRFRDQFGQLRHSYAQRLEETMQTIEALWQQVIQNKQDTSALEVLHRTVHSIAGSGTTFGFAEVSAAARTLELQLQAILEESSEPTDEQGYQINDSIDTLKQALEQTTPLSPGEQHAHTNQYLLSGSQAHYHAPPDNRLIFLVEDDALLARDLALQIGHFGYTVESLDHPGKLQEALQQQTPAAIIMDIMFPESDSAGTAIITMMQQTLPTQIPTMFISARGDVVSRLRAVRAGGNAYLTKPIDVSLLIDKLDTLTNHRPPEPYRILIVEDEAPLAGYYQSVLQQADMEAFIITDPLQVLHALVEFSPDLILMDVYMPGCNGLELAAVIRQDEAYVGIPIVFLSAETRLHKQLGAMQKGGDDFLTKPIQPTHLISAITSRAQRSRALRASMIRDGLTGLLNHTTMKEQINREVVLAQRRNTPAAFAMIDLDHFKNINDTYGHSVGDRVLKSLSRVLQQRLRKTDIIGRYGGEEFAVMMPDTDGVSASLVLDDIRQGFAHVRQRADGQEFSVTFSCGIASFPHYDDITLLNKAADQALYEAKNKGRNQVILAESSHL